LSLGRASRDAAAAIYCVEANLDDCSPQLIGALMEELLELGALDAYVVPATMKKGRPGHLLGALVSAGRRDAIIDALLTGSTTLGARCYAVDRVELDRRFEEGDTRYGRVRIKVALRNGAVINAQPEFEDCRLLARQHHVPVKEVLAEALACYRRAKRDPAIEGHRSNRPNRPPPSGPPPPTLYPLAADAAKQADDLVAPPPRSNVHHKKL